MILFVLDILLNIIPAFRLLHADFHDPNGYWKLGRSLFVLFMIPVPIILRNRPYLWQWVLLLNLHILKYLNQNHSSYCYSSYSFINRCCSTEITTYKWWSFTKLSRYYHWFLGDLVSLLRCYISSVMLLLYYSYNMRCLVKYVCHYLIFHIQRLVSCWKHLPFYSHNMLASCSWCAHRLLSGIFSC